jgi:argininosuccinate lyase/amino-acid N-acetyltransferase
MAEQPSKAVWQGRITAGLDARAQKLNDSLPVDRRLWPEELALSRAYARAIAEAGVLDRGELEALLAACDSLDDDLAAGTVAMTGEDVHSMVEAELARRCGDPGLKLHTGRSRNDQVATLMRMRVMQLCEEAVENLRHLERALVMRARACGNRVVAAYTHLQPAQPILLAHWWLAHVAALERDEERFENVREAADLMPLGSGAVAGTPLRYDRARLATWLGFSRLAANSLDAVGDRDFALEYLNAAALLGVHLSRLAEDLVLWCSPGLGWYRPGDGFSTGSSLLPQKRNPDLFELARGKSGRLLANAQRLAVVLKGLPSAYQKDLQEDKEAVFDSADTLAALLVALPPAIRSLEERGDRMEQTVTVDLLAVELADELVEGGMPFREAHARVGRLWAEAERLGATPREVPESARLAIAPEFTDARLASLSAENALARRGTPPGAGPESVASQLAWHEGRLGLGPRVPAAHVVEEPPWEGWRTAENGPATGAASGNGGAGVPEDETFEDGLTLRRARLEDVPGIAAVMADYVIKAVLLPRPVSDLFQCVREFHVALSGGEIVACAALRLLWDDLGEVRSLAVRPDFHGRGLGAKLVARVLDDARALGVPRVIALTREVAFFERCGFKVEPRESLPRKVWTDCVRCPRRHACDEVAVVCDLVPGASEADARARLSRGRAIPGGTVPMMPLPIVS